MSRWPGTRLLLFGLGLCFLSAFTAATPAQTPDVGGTPAVVAPAVEPLRLPQDPQARRRLEAAHDYVQARRWAEAVRVLQGLLESGADSFHEVVSHDGGGKTQRRWKSVRSEAEELLAGLPADGMDFYRATYEAAARQALVAALAHQDWDALREVVRRYRHTKAGAEALQHLAAYHLDRGQAQLADACYQQLLRSAGADRLPPLVLFKAALVAHLAGAEELDTTPGWREFIQRLGSEELAIGNRTYPAHELREVLEHWPRRAADQYLLYRGDVTRAGQGQADVFLLEPQWRLATARGEARSLLVECEREGRSQRQCCLPGTMPLALDGKLIFRSANGLHAVEAQTGRPLWQRPSLRSLSAVLASPEQRAELKSWLKMYGDGKQFALVDNSLLGTLSSDGRHVYAIEDLPLPPHPSLQENGVNRSPVLAPLYRAARFNSLRALDAATGQLLWEVGGPADAKPKREAALAGVRFLGAPLPLGKELFVAVRNDQQFRLLCLDAERGRVRWNQRLTVGGGLAPNAVRDTQAVHLAYAEGVLICPTHHGALFGVDPLTRRLRWVYFYGEPPAASTEEQSAQPSAVPSAGWKGAAPLLHAGRIVFTPPDSEAIYCLRLRDGAPVWKAKRGKEDLYVGCIHNDGVLLIGRSSCRMLSLKSGQVLWQRRTGEPAGQGIAAGGRYYLPLRGGTILALNLDRPAESVRLRSPAMRGELGNLLFHQGTLCSQSATEVLAFTPWKTQLARLEKRLARSPQDLSLLFERGRLHLEHGNLAAAAADLHRALEHGPAPALEASVREQLYSALTQLLQHDFPTGEKYLEAYRSLCDLPIPESAEGRKRAELEAERRRRQTLFLAVLGRGREKQGRVIEALQAYRELSHRAAELMNVPDDGALRTRPDLWVRQRVAEMLAQAGASQRRRIGEEIRREGQALLRSYDLAALRSFLALFGGVQGEEAGLVAEVRLRLARQLARATERRHGLEAELLLHDPRGHVALPLLSAQARYEQALLLTRYGLLEEAVEAYRLLAREHGSTPVTKGKTGLQIQEELQTDRRFLPYLDPPVAVRSASKVRSAGPARRRSDALRVPCVLYVPQPDDSIRVTAPALALPQTRETPEWCSRLRFVVDGRTVCLRAAERVGGAELFSVPLPLPSLPTELRKGPIPFHAVDHLLVLPLGQTLVGVDLLQRRVRWRFKMSPGEGLDFVSASVVCLHGGGAVTALDPASGEVRWTRKVGTRELSIHGGAEFLFLVERATDGGIGAAVRAVRAHDGVVVALADAVAALRKNR